VVQQSYKDRLSLDQVEVLNTVCKNEEKSSLNILLKEILTADAVNKTIVNSDKMVKISKY